MTEKQIQAEATRLLQDLLPMIEIMKSQHRGKAPELLHFSVFEDYVCLRFLDPDTADAWSAGRSS